MLDSGVGYVRKEKAGISPPLSVINIQGRLISVALDTLYLSNCVRLVYPEWNLSDSSIFVEIAKTGRFQQNQDF